MVQETPTLDECLGSPELAVGGPTSFGDILDLGFAPCNCHFQVFGHNDPDRSFLLEQPPRFLLGCISVLCLCNRCIIISAGGCSDGLCAVLELVVFLRFGGFVARHC